MAREMKDSGIAWIGEIPKDWHIARTKSRYSHHKTVASEHADGYERLALTLNGVIKRSKEDFVGLQPEAFNSYQILRPNELVFKLIDLANVATSRVGYSPYLGIVSPAYIILEPRLKDESKYGIFYFLSMWQREIFNHLGDDGVRSSLNAGDLLNIPYLIVPQNEQARIADFLDRRCTEIDRIMEQTRVTIEEYKKLKQSIITEAVTHGVQGPRKMKESGVEWIGEIPVEWEVCKVRHIGKTQNGISKSGDFFGEGYPFVSYGDVYRNMILPHHVEGLVLSTEEEQKLYSVQKGDIFFTRTSETIEEVGFSSVCEETIPNATFAGFLIRVRPFNDKLDIGYSKYYFRSGHHRFYLVKQMNLVTRASLGQTLLKGMHVLVPPKAEQIEIADYLDHHCTEIDRLIDSKQQLLTELEAYKKSVIYEYVTGKREVSQ